MVNFNNAFGILIENEGLYSNDKRDSGGETVWGISRNNFPNLPIWKIVDESKKLDNFPYNLSDNPETIKQVWNFYFENFWQQINGDSINDQDKANILFDFSVNSGVKQAVKIAQRALGVPDDGIMGARTLLALNDTDLELFVLRFKIKKIEFYISIVDRKPDQIRFLKGWINRALK